MTTIVALLLVIILVLLLSALGRSRPPQRRAAHAEPEPYEPEPHPRSASGVAQPRPHERVTPYQLTLTPPARGTPPRKVRSSRDRSVSYEVDPARLTCTCPDYQKRRADLPEASFARCCKHLLRVLDEQGHLAEADKWVKAIASAGYGAPVEAWLIQLDTAPPALVAVAPDKQWVDVYAHTPRRGERIKTATGPIDRFGWNVDEDRWSYSEGPPGSRELTPLMKQVL